MEKLKIDLMVNVLKKDTLILMAYLFGSQLEGRANEYSDIDVAILFDDKVEVGVYTDKQILIATLLSEKLNKEIDIVVLNRASLFLRYHVLKDGLKIYERDDRNEHNFEAQAIMEYFDFLPIRSRIENGLLSKLKAGKW